MLVDDRPAHVVSLPQLAVLFLYIGLTGYGGGPAIVGIIQRELVERRKWLSEEDFFAGLSLAQMLPGAMVVDTVTFIGYRLAGAWGAVIVPAVFLFPSVVLMTALSALYFRFGDVPVVHALFKGLGAVVVGMIINALVVMARPALKDAPAEGLAVAAFLLVQFAHLHVMLVVAMGAAAGLLIYRSTTGEVEAAPPQRVPRALWFGLAVAAAVLAGLLCLTWSSPFTQMALAFLRIGLFSFGGGFAAIPLYQQEAVVTHGWLTAHQLADGIALGQVTPGPVLVTATFIGYHVLGVTGALLSTIGAFLPGITAMFILAHGHERVSHLPALRAVVRGGIATYIGIIASVVVVLARSGIMDTLTAVFAAVSLLVLLVAKKDPLWVILPAAILSPFVFR